jgi:6-phosphogluconolactonase
MRTNGRTQILVYVGAYTRPVPPWLGTGSGIEVYELDQATGALTPIGVRDGVDNPSYLVVDSRRRHVYCVEEIAEGQVWAFSIHADTGDLVPLNHQSSEGAGPAHVSLDREGRWVLVANYGSGSVAILPIQEDGSLGPATASIEHPREGIRSDRPRQPHAHWIGPDAANRFMLVADLGLDAIISYRLDTTNGGLIRRDPGVGVTTVQAGSGPRHLAFHPNGRYVYVLNELDSTLVACAYDASTGSPLILQRLSTVPADFTGTNWPAAVRVAPSGRFVYTSNRGHDSIAIFSIDPATGRLGGIGHQSTHGRTPRDFNIDPTGTFLLVAHQESNTIVTFVINPITGALSETGHVVVANTPTCLDFAPLV